MSIKVLEIDSQNPFETTVVSGSSILVVNNFLDDEFCDEIISQFEKNPEVSLQEIIAPTYQYAKTNISQKPALFEEYTNFITDRFKEAVGFYAQQLNIREQQWPTEYGYEEFNMFKFNAETGYQNAHVAVTDLSSARRFLNCIWFLNDGGGNMEMYINDTLIDIKPQKGRVVMFPANWIYPYAIKSPKFDQYMIGSYLHYT